LRDPGGLDLERDPAHGGEDRVDRDDPDNRRLLVLVGRDVAPTPLHGDVDRQPGPVGHGGDVHLGVEDLDVGRDLDVAGGDLTGAASVEAEDDGFVGLDGEHQVL